MASQKILLSVVLATIVLGGLLAYRYVAPSEAEKAFILKPDDTEITSLGREIYADHCASCHGVNLEGEANWRQRKPSGRLPAPPHDETGHTWHHADGVLINLTKYGPQYAAGADYQSDMPAFDDILSDSEIIAVLSYIKSTWQPKTRATHDEINRRSVIQ